LSKFEKNISINKDLHNDIGQLDNDDEIFSI